MLCPNCHRQIERGSTFCPSCGTSLTGAAGVFELVLRDGTRVPVLDEMTIGRAPGNTLPLDDPSVSRHHARITSGDPTRAPRLEDAGSSHGTWLDGQLVEGTGSLGDGSRITLGDEVLRVERKRGASEAGDTIVVPPGDSLILPASGAEAVLAPATSNVAERPRRRSGYALKRLHTGGGARRWGSNALPQDKVL